MDSVGGYAPGDRVVCRGVVLVVVQPRRYGLEDYLLVRYPDGLVGMVPVVDVSSPPSE